MNIYYVKYSVFWRIKKQLDGKVFWRIKGMLQVKQVAPSDEVKKLLIKECEYIG